MLSPLTHADTRKRRSEKDKKILKKGLTMGEISVKIIRRLEGKGT